MVTHEGLVSFDGVSWQYGGKEVQVWLCNGKFEICYGETLVATHQIRHHKGKIIIFPILYGRDRTVVELEHAKTLLEYMGLETAA